MTYPKKRIYYVPSAESDHLRWGFAHRTTIFIEYCSNHILHDK
ncbi:hypothetical protein [Nostoc sp. MS1]|nr:hypothetical protein [Nostoc sp. MS1]